MLTPLLSDDAYWQAICARDRAWDEHFVFAVRTTGIYCRPSCAARRPLRHNVLYFATPLQAEEAGYRACRRCAPNSTAPSLVERARVYIDTHADEHITLHILAAQVCCSPAHLQRTFQRVVGVSPHSYLRARRMEGFKQQVRAGATVTTALYAAGYDSSHALYAQAHSALGMTPATYRHGGRGQQIAYTVASCALGWVLVAATERGVCMVSLDDAPAALEEALVTEFPAATLVRSDADLEAWVMPIVRFVTGAQQALEEVPVDAAGTRFQQRVWQALRAIPYGSTRTYRDIATQIGQPTAARAVARACATNPVSLVIPCHRVVRASGEVSGYRWGVQRKQSLLAQERRLADLS